ncbi:MAG: anthranilate synthase component I [Sporolactobacillus sp.]|jgi:anthranilate synthase|nr:anthranilate synthase component I [Sporolactobacillus sp.]
MNFSFLRDEPRSAVFTTDAGLRISRHRSTVDPQRSLSGLIDRLNRRKGALFSSNYAVPGRYSKWDIGFIDPPLELTAKKERFRIRPLNRRGRILISYFQAHLNDPALSIAEDDTGAIVGSILRDIDASDRIEETNRTKQASLFTLLRHLQHLLRSDDEFLGFYGAFGFDLIRQFESFPLGKKRNPMQNDLQLYVPDRLIVHDREQEEAFFLTYEFAVNGQTTEGLPTDGTDDLWHSPAGSKAAAMSERPGDYAQLVRLAKQAFKSGDLFEVVPSRVLPRQCGSLPSEVFRRLQTINPSPYGFFIHLNGGEFLVGCSPEMFVRVDGRVIETSPISGTIRRSGSPLEDAEQIKTLLGSEKEEAELTMCTDVDRNDKSRICVPGSVKVVARRQIEAYSHLFHTVDHIKGLLKPGFDAIDAFISHMWAVTVTGAPKLEAIKWIERHEQLPRNWYGGAVGWIGANGNMNTGLTLRCLRLHNGMAQIRVGATLLYDSDPESEERETLTKAEALLEALNPVADSTIEDENVAPAADARPLRLLFVDHEDSFVHTLSAYFQALGERITVLRSPAARRAIEEGKLPVDLVVLSPGPGRPERFRMSETIRLCLQKHLPIFGVCLGLQGIVRYFGGDLGELPVPAHGRSSVITVDRRSPLFCNLPARFRAGRYHSLYAARVPAGLRVTARSKNGVVMAVEHRSLPIWALQFHPESIMTANNGAGMQIIKNVAAAAASLRIMREAARS